MRKTTKKAGAASPLLSPKSLNPNESLPTGLKHAPFRKGLQVSLRPSHKIHQKPVTQNTQNNTPRALQARSASRARARQTQIGAGGHLELIVSAREGVPVLLIVIWQAAPCLFRARVTSCGGASGARSARATSALARERGGAVRGAAIASALRAKND